MHTWEEELQAYRRRTKKSARAWEAAKRHIPFGVNSNLFGYDWVDAGRLADHLCGRFHLDRLKFSMTGLDATLFAVRLARAVTGRRRILKFEGCYHGSHDSLMVSIKPRKELSGDPK